MALDLESGISSRDTAAIQGYGSVPERTEEHQAEEPPLKSVNGSWAANIDSEASQTSSSNTLQSQEAPNNPSLSGHNAGGMPPNRQLSSMNEPIYVQFEDDDPDNPFDWPLRRKWIITCVG